MDVISLINQLGSTRTRTALATYSIPVPYVQGNLRISRLENGTYCSNPPFSQKFPPELLTRGDVFLVCDGVPFKIEPLKLENKDTQFIYSINNPEEQNIPAIGTFCIEKQFLLYPLADMSNMQRLKIGGIESGLGKLQDQLNPLNVVWSAGEVIYQLEKDIDSYKLDANDMVTVDGRVKDQLWLDEQRQGIAAISAAMNALMDAATSRFVISPPITGLQYTTQAHILHIDCIISILDIPEAESGFIKTLSPKEAADMHASLTSKMNEAYAEKAPKEPDLDKIVPEEAVSEENKKKPESQTGSNEEDKLNKNSGSLPDVLEPEPLPSTTPSITAPLAS